VMYSSNGSSSWAWIRVYKYIDTKVTVSVGADSPVGTVPVAANPDELKRQSFSLSLWCKPSSLASNLTLASSGRGTNKGWVLRILPGGTVEFRAWDGASSAAAVSSSSLTISAMHHVGVAFDAAAGDCRLFVDGQKEFDGDLGINPVAYQFTAGSGDDDILIGKDSQAPANNMDGVVDDVRYYDDVLIDTVFSSQYQEVAGVEMVTWVGYTREPGNIYLRKDDPLTAESLVVPGSVLDVGYNPTFDEIEIMYVHNGKVFVTYGSVNETPSTLTQPSVLKDALRTGSVGESSSSDYNAPLPPVIAPLNSPPSPINLIIPPVSSAIVVGYEIWKVNSGKSVMVAFVPYINDSQVFTDDAWAIGDGYKIRSIYSDPGSPERRRSGQFGQVVFPSGAGDVLKPGYVGKSPSVGIVTITITPIKISKTENITTGIIGLNESSNILIVNFSVEKIFIDDSVVTGVPGSNQDGSGYSSSAYLPSGTSASMDPSIGGHIVVTGLSQISPNHRFRGINLSATSNTLNSGMFKIVDVISSSSVRIYAPYSPGSDASNGSIDWYIDHYVPTSSLIAKSYNTLDIGIG